MRISIGVLAVLLAATACRTARVETTAGGGAPPSPAATPATAAYLPAGAQLSVRLDAMLSTESSRVGDRFTATVDRAIIAQNGAVAVPEGAVVRGQVTGLHASRRVGDPAVIRLAFDQITVRGRSLPLAADVVATDVKVKNVADLERVARDAGLGAAAGAALGAILTGDLEKTVTGAILGAGVGTVISLGRGEVQAALPAGTEMTLRTTAGVDLR